MSVNLATRSDAERRGVDAERRACLIYTKRSQMDEDVWDKWARGELARIPEQDRQVAKDKLNSLCGRRRK